MTGECDGGLAGRLFGHKMRPRYSETSEWPAGTTYKGPSGWIDPEDAVAITRASKNTRRTYEGDVCERCGYTTRTEGKP
jgi:hypothetical protein